MVGYFLSCGDETVCQMFSPYLWGENGFSTLFESKFINKDYGSNLNLLLIKYYVEGRFDIHGPENFKLGNYSRKNKNIAVDVAVKKENFHNKNEFERREFVVDSSTNAIIGVKNKFEKAKILFDFHELIKDIKEVTSEYLRFSGMIGDEIK